MDAQDLQRRTRQFGLRVMNLIEAVPSSKTANPIRRRLLSSAISVGANYRAACRARTRPDFTSRVGIAIEEADQSLYWMEMLVDAKMMPGSKLTALMTEGNEIIASLIASTKTARTRPKPRPKPRGSR